MKRFLFFAAVTLCIALVAFAAPAPGYFNSLFIGGGYGDSGTYIDDMGAIRTDANITVGGRIISGSGSHFITSSAGLIDAGKVDSATNLTVTNFSATGTFTATVDTEDLADDAVTAAKLDDSASFTMDKLTASSLEATEHNLQSWWIPASDIIPCSASPAGGPTIFTANNNYIQSVDFDSSQLERAMFTFYLPSDMKDSLTLDIKLVWTATSGSLADGVVWGLGIHSAGDDDTLQVTHTVTTLTTALLTAAYDVHEETYSYSYGTAPRMVVVLIERDGADLGDTLSADALLMGVSIEATGTL